jgi:putative membrane protein
MSRNERDFIRRATDNNTLEVALGEMAQHQAASERVKQFGQVMARDYALASNRLLEIAKKDSFQVPADLDKDEYSILRDLEGLRGRDFDRAYMKHILEDNKGDLALFEQTARNGASPDLRDYARQNLGVIGEHLRSAQDIYNEIEKRG